MPGTDIACGVREPRRRPVSAGVLPGECGRGERGEREQREQRAEWEQRQEWGRGRTRRRRREEGGRGVQTDWERCVGFCGGLARGEESEKRQKASGRAREAEDNSRGGEQPEESRAVRSCSRSHPCFSPFLPSSFPTSLPSSLPRARSLSSPAGLGRWHARQHANLQ
eukprot:1125239-Rhodomonas_salina.1